MECLTKERIQDYIDGSLNSVENAMVRDHLIVCRECKKVYRQYEMLETHLMQPVELTPPPVIEQNVLSTLFPALPTYSSIMALIAASFVLLVTSIYVYFDFANNSIVQAFQLTSSSASNWIGAIIKGISTVFTVVYTLFKVLNRLFNVLLNINLGVEIVGLTVCLIFALTFYSFFKLTVKKIKT